MKLYIKSSQAIYAGYSCDGWFNILKTQWQRIPDPWWEKRKEGWQWCHPSNHPNYVKDGYDAVCTYTGDSAYLDVNNYLRGKPYRKDGWWFTTPRKLANRVHKVISRANLPIDMVTVRWAKPDNIDSYLGNGAADNIREGNGDQYIGKIVKEKGFYSSSMSPYPPQGVYRGREVQFITLLPKGTNAIYIDENTSRYGKEDEILVLDKTSFIIRDIQYSETGFDDFVGEQSEAKYRIFMEKI